MNALRNFNVKCVRRYNPKKKRKFKITFTCDGIAHTAKAKQIDTICRNLISNLSIKNKLTTDFIIARDRASLIFATTICSLTGIPMSVAYKYDLDLNNQITLVDHYIPDEPAYLYNIKGPCNVVIVDDEVLTGNTMFETIKSLKKNDISILAAFCIVESINFNARMRIEKTGIPFYSYYKYSLPPNDVNYVKSCIDE